MATRINISVPDELAARIERYRDRLIVSRICSDALNKEVSALEHAETAPRDLQSIIARLKEQKNMKQNEDFELGFDCGIEYGQAANYEDLVRLSCSAPLDVLPDDAQYTLDSLIQQGDILDVEQFIAGWHKGLRAFWDEIKDKI